MQLYAHQKKIIEDDPRYALIALGTGGGKTRVCLELSEGATLVICPKQQKLDQTWEKNCDKFGIICNLTVVSKEEFRRDWAKLPRFDTVIVDECHTVLGVLPETRVKNKKKIPKTSKLFEAVYSYVAKNRPNRLYLASATPVTKPMHLWAISQLMGKNWNFWSFREDYYIERMMGMRRIFIPKNDKATKNKLAQLTKMFGYTGKLSDWFDVPEQTHKVVHFDLTDEQQEALDTIDMEEADPLVRRARHRTIENGVLYAKKIESTTEGDQAVDKLVDDVKIFRSEKIDYILERAQEFPKMLIFANYTAQINQIEIALKDAGYSTYTLTGKTKDRGTLIERAEKAEEAIVIAQTSISAGYELPSFPCVIYASKSYRYVDYEQSLGRVLRANALKKNLYIHLVVSDGVDEACHDTIMSGQDFQEKVMSSYPQNDIDSDSDI